MHQDILNKQYYLCILVGSVIIPYKVLKNISLISEETKRNILICNIIFLIYLKQHYLYIQYVPFSPPTVEIFPHFIMSFNYLKLNVYMPTFNSLYFMGMKFLGIRKKMCYIYATIKAQVCQFMIFCCCKA